MAGCLRKPHEQTLFDRRNSLLGCTMLLMIHITIIEPRVRGIRIAGFMPICCCWPAFGLALTPITGGSFRDFSGFGATLVPYPPGVSLLPATNLLLLRNSTMTRPICFADLCRTSLTYSPRVMEETETKAGATKSAASTFIGRHCL